MKILVIDGQGGNIGRQLVKMICENFPSADVTAVGTNSIATANMLEGGAVTAATGENAAIVGCRKADIIVGPLGIAIADSLGGEVTPKMAVAVGQSDAYRVFIPMSKCGNIVAGVRDASTTALIEDAIEKIRSVIENNA